MNESDAYKIGQQDAAIAGQRINQAQDPASAEQTIFQFIFHRLDEMIGRARRKALQQSLQIGHSRMTSERIANIAIKIVEICDRALIPEDSYALMSWMCGSKEEGPGFLQHTLLMIPDKNTEHAIAAIQRTVVQVRNGLLARDRHMLTEKKGQLRSQQERFIDGMLYEARLASQQEDGERARDKMILVRRTISRFERTNADHRP